MNVSQKFNTLSLALAKFNVSNLETNRPSTFDGSEAGEKGVICLNQVESILFIFQSKTW